MNKKPDGSFKLIIEAGKANPAPPIGPALGQRKLNIMEFCKTFNDLTSKMSGPVPVVIEYTKDGKLLPLIIKTPPASYMITQALGLKGGSKLPGKESFAVLKASQAKEIAEKKQKDLTAHSAEAATKIIIGTAISMGISIDYNS